LKIFSKKKFSRIIIIFYSVWLKLENELDIFCHSISKIQFNFLSCAPFNNNNYFLIFNYFNFNFLIFLFLILLLQSIAATKNSQQLTKGDLKLTSLEKAC